MNRRESETIMKASAAAGEAGDRVKIASRELVAGLKLERGGVRVKSPKMKTQNKMYKAIDMALSRYERKSSAIAARVNHGTR